MYVGAFLQICTTVTYTPIQRSVIIHAITSPTLVLNCQSLQLELLQHKVDTKININHVYPSLSFFSAK